MAGVWVVLQHRDGKFHRMSREAVAAAQRLAARSGAKATAVLSVLDARGLRVSPSQRDRIVACTKLATLDLWVRRAATIGATSELFEEPSPSPRRRRTPARRASP